MVGLFLIFVRVGAVLLSAPFFSHTAVPVRVRILVAILLSFALSGMSGPVALSIDNPVALMAAVLVEVGTGLTIGFVAQFLFWSVQFAAEILGFQMGLSLAQVYAPSEGLATNPIGRFISLGLLMVFILLDGPQDIVRAIALSIQVIPPGEANLAGPSGELVKWAGQLFSVGVRFAAPFIISFLLVEFSLGIFARVVPQADLFSLGLPIKLMAGLGLTLLFSRALFAAFPGLIVDTMETVQRIIAGMTPIF